MKSIKKLYSDDQRPQTKVHSVSSNDPAAETDVLAKALRIDDEATRNRPAAERPTSMEDLARVIIHEIRNPLTTISLANQSLVEEVQFGDLPVSLNPLTTIISKNISRIESLLRDLLYINSGGEPDFNPIDISEVIDESLGKADDRIFLKNVDVTRSYNPGIQVMGNFQNLTVAFLNILVNAIEAVKEDEGKIWITVFRVKNEVRVVFKDNGLGMEPDVAMHMFDSNFSGKMRGLGVGLTHVKEILSNHRASISVSSEPGTGTLIVLGFRAV